MQNARLDEAQAGIKIAWRSIITSDMQMIPPLQQKVKKNQKPLDEVNEVSIKAGLKLWKLRSWHPVPSLQVKQMVKQWKQWQTFLFLGSKITADGDCSHEIKRLFLLGRKAMTNLDSILQSRDITLLTNVHLVKAMVFPTVMYGCESWTIKEAESWRIAAFELWCWRRLLRIPWTARRSNQSILKKFSPEYSLEGLMLKLKL